jgi:hypothetical protein
MSASNSLVQPHESKSVEHFPNFIISERKGVVDNDQFEDPTDEADNPKEQYAIHARNLLRHIFRGTPLCKEKGAHYSQSLLAQDKIFNCLFTKRDHDLLLAVRQEMQKILNHSFTQLQSSAFRSSHEPQYEIFQSGLLATYAFMDPVNGESITIPQKINGTWIQVPYRFESLDISPRSGPLSWVIEEEDRMYAYGLVPDAEKKAPAEAEPILCCVGTTYPAGQGVGVAITYNFYPRSSIGEAHEMKEIAGFLNRQKAAHKKVKITGHSKGAVMAMIIAAQYPDLVIQADCLNPAGLCGSTLDRLSPAWDAYTGEKPKINIYAQKGDPVFPLEKGFLKGTNLIRVLPFTDELAMNCSASICGFSISIPRWFREAQERHLHHLSGRSQTRFETIDLQKENNSKKREVFNDIKWLLNWPRFCMEYVELFARIAARKVERFYDKNKKLLACLIIVTALTLCGALAFTGALVPLIVPLIKAFTGYNLSAGPLYAMCALGSLLLPPSLYVATKFAVLIAKVANVAVAIAVHVAAIVIGGIGSVIKVFVIKPFCRAIFSGCSSQSDADHERSAEGNTSTLRRVKSSSALVSEVSNMPLVRHQKGEVGARTRSYSMSDILKPEPVVDRASLPGAPESPPLLRI